MLSEPVRGTPWQWDEVTVRDIERMLRWWITRANDVWDTIMDPARYRNDDGSYDARTHFGALLSLERLFACVQGVLVGTAREEFSRMMYLFEALELLGGLGYGTYASTLDYVEVTRKLGTWYRSLPQGVQRLALPRCVYGALSLQRLSAGFWRTPSDEPVRVPDGVGGSKAVPRNQAVAAYVRAVRKGAHSLRIALAERPDDISLLAQHDGNIPHGLPELAFHHLLRVLMEPNRLTA